MSMSVIRTHRLCTSKWHVGARWMSWTSFHVKVWGDEEGTWPAQLQSWCMGCGRIASRRRSAVRRGVEVEEGWRGKPRDAGDKLGDEEIRRRKRERYRVWIQEPGNRERRAEGQREYMREWSAAARRRAGVPERGRRRNGRVGAETRVMLDSGPLIAWMDDPWEEWKGRLSDAGRTALARGRVQGVMELGAIDRVCVELGREEMVSVLYGEA